MSDVGMSASNTMACCDDETRKGKQGRHTARRRNNQPNKAGVMRCARGRDATTRQDETRQRDDKTTCCDNETWQRNAVQTGVAMRRNDATGQRKWRDTAQQCNNQPNKRTRKEAKARRREAKTMQREGTRGSGEFFFINSHHFQGGGGYVEVLST